MELHENGTFIPWHFYGLLRRSSMHFSCTCGYNRQNTNLTPLLKRFITLLGHSDEYEYEYIVFYTLFTCSYIAAKDSCWDFVGIE